MLNVGNENVLSLINLPSVVPLGYLNLICLDSSLLNRPIIDLSAIYVNAYFMNALFLYHGLYSVFIKAICICPGFTMQSLSTNLTVNKTDALDFFCTEFVGPLVWGIFTVPCACVGVPASMWLLRILIQRQRSGVSNDVYMLNLTIMDLYFTLFTIPDVLNYLIFRNRVFLKISDTIFSFASPGRPLLMSCICVDCYMAVVHPIQYMLLKHSRYRTVTSALVWGLTLVYGILSALNRHIFATSFTAIPYVLTVPTIIYCDVAILLALRKPHPSGRSDVHELKERAMQTITNSLVMTFLSYLPPLIVISLLSLLPLSIEEKICNISLPILIAPILGSNIMPLLSVKNLRGPRCGKMCSA